MKTKVKRTAIFYVVAQDSVSVEIPSDFPENPEDFTESQLEFLRESAEEKFIDLFPEWFFCENEALKVETDQD